jgi:hypothetical protein
MDGTLLHHPGDLEDTPRYDVIDLFRWFQAHGHDMVIWSGGGIDYATRWARRMGLEARIIEKGSITPDLAVDDEEVKLGTLNLKVN